VEERPELANTPVVSHALAALVRTAQPWSEASPAPGTKGDTVVFWLRVGRDGRVQDGSWQVISFTSHAARDAAEAALPYLRYAAGTYGGERVDVWVTQRMVIEP
jgi:hypothetical protein